MLKVGIMAGGSVFRIEQFFAFRGKHIRAGMLFVNQNDSAGLHTLCDDGKEAIQVGEPAET